MLNIEKHKKIATFIFLTVVIIVGYRDGLDESAPSFYVIFIFLLGIYFSHLVHYAIRAYPAIDFYSEVQTGAYAFFFWILFLISCAYALFDWSLY